MMKTLCGCAAMTVMAVCAMPTASTAQTTGSDASTKAGLQGIQLAMLEKYYARQHLPMNRTASSTTPTDPNSPTSPPAEPDETNDLLRCAAPQEGVTALGNYNYAERGQSWRLENGPAICGSKASDTAGTTCLAQRNKSVSPWTFYIIYGSKPPIGATGTFGRAASSCTYGPGKKLATLVAEPPKVTCGEFTRNLRLGDNSDINDGGYAANLDEARARCNAVATPTKGYCVAYRNEGSNAGYIILIGGDHGTAPNYGGTEGWVARCE